MNRTTRRSLVMLAAAPMMAAGLFVTAPAQAQAAVGDATCTNSMAMPSTTADSAGPGMLTRAGQLAASAPAADSGAAMASGCSTASHG